MNSSYSIPQRRQLIKEIIHKSLVNRQTTIIEHSDTTLVGLSGSIIKDTSQMISLSTNKSTKKIMKKTAEFRFDIDDISVKIQGDLLIGDLKKRSKRKIRKW